jgi:Stage II sporulation protein E (SpoIIE)
LQPAAQPLSARRQARVRHNESKGATDRHRERLRETGRSREAGKRSKKSQPPPVVGETTPTAPALLEPAALIASTASTSSANNVTTPTQAVPPVVINTLTQAASGLTPSAARGALATHRSQVRTHAITGILQPAATLAAVAATPTMATHIARLRGTRKHASKAGSASPLTTTITRIVDVVPMPVRMLIAALLGLALALALRSRMSALRARRLERQRVELLEDVGLLQAALLPVPPVRLGPVGTSVAYQPAAGPGAGGDFYDVFALEDGQLGVIVGDVSGHGRHALPHTALVRFTLRAYLEAGLLPREAVQTAGAVLARQLGEQFATVVLATYNPRDRVLAYACAGHPPPVVLGLGAGAVESVTVCSSPPIGVGLRTGTRQTVVSVPGRSQICFYTDGVTEARVGGELFGGERLLETLTELGSQATAATLLDSVVENVDAHPDDMAACLLRVEGGDAAPAVLVEELELDREECKSERAERFLLACGVERGEVTEVIGAARAAAGDADTVVLECRRADGAPQVTLRRDHLAYLHVRRSNMEVCQ